jgi:hypothetical protein
MQKPTRDADIEDAVQAELPWLLERARARDAAASDDTVSGRLRSAVTASRQPYEQVSQAIAAAPMQRPVPTTPLGLPGRN